MLRPSAEFKQTKIAISPVVIATLAPTGLHPKQRVSTRLIVVSNCFLSLPSVLCQPVIDLIHYRAGPNFATPSLLFRSHPAIVLWPFNDRAYRDRLKSISPLRALINK